MINDVVPSSSGTLLRTSNHWNGMSKKFNDEEDVEECNYDPF